MTCDERRPAVPGEEIYTGLTQIFRTVFRRPAMELLAELTARDVPGWDSFKQLEIILAVEETYDIMLLPEELDKMRSVGDLARTVHAKVAGRRQTSA